MTLRSRVAAVALCCAVILRAQITPEQTEFFEKKIRPVLVERCYGCHGAEITQPLGGLRLDTAARLRKGGDSGPVITPGDPAASLLIAAISYRNPDLKMPPSGKLKDQQIADFTEWIKMGAPDPRGDETAPAPAKKGIDFTAARKFWSFQPLKHPAPDASIDRFLRAKLDEKHLQPAAPADKRTHRARPSI
jgi:hypothetical protein